MIKGSARNVIEKGSGFTLLFKSNPWYTILLFVFHSYLLLSISRAGLVIWQWDRVDSLKNALKIMIYGIRMDTIIICYLIALPVLVAPFTNGYRLTRKLWFYFSSIWFSLSILYLFFMESVTPFFITQYDTRPNRLFVEYLEYPKEVFLMLYEGFKVELFSGLAALFVGIYILYRFYPGVFRREAKWSILPRIIVLPVLMLLIFGGARSSLSHRPANPSTVVFSSDSMVNSLPLSSGYSLIYAIYRMKDEKDAARMYGTVDKETMLRNVRENCKRECDFNNKSIPTLHRFDPSYKRDKPFNLVIVLEESFGAEFIGSLGGPEGITPRFEKLTKKGVYFNNLYATGTRSARGIEAVITGFFPSPARSIVKLGKARRNFFTLASFLKEKGYKTRFVFGNNADFDNMETFFKGNGFDEIIDVHDYKTFTFKSSWGVCDEDLFEMAHRKLMDDGDKPSFSLVFTGSNHTPFDYPEGKIIHYNKPAQTVENAVKYADFALGKFFEKAEKSPYWNNTVFLVVADHCSRVYGNALVPVKRFHIPALIIAPELKPSIYSKIASQVDLPVTLLSVMGQGGDIPMMGRDLTRLDENVPGRAVMQFFTNQAYMEKDRILILEPGEKYIQFSFKGKEQIESKVDPILLEKALSSAQWASWTYSKKLYRSK